MFQLNTNPLSQKEIDKRAEWHKDYPFHLKAMSFAYTLHRYNELAKAFIMSFGHANPIDEVFPTFSALQSTLIDTFCKSADDYDWKNLEYQYDNMTISMPLNINNKKWI